MKTLVVTAAVLAALLSAAPVLDDESDPGQTLALVRAADPPVRDLTAIRARIQNPASRPVVAQPLGADALWINNLVHHTYELVPVELRFSSPHADWFVQRDRQTEGLDAAVEFFESQTLPRVQELTGVQWAPGSDGQQRLAIFNGRLRGVSGYMSASDAVPRSVFPYSNERLIVYVNIDAVRPGSRAYNRTLAHELEHLAHFVVNPTQEGWFDEGLADLVSFLVLDESPPALSSFRERPDVQLTAWSAKPSEAGLHYQASHLWSRYLMERGGGAASLRDLVRAGARGLETADRFARDRGLAEGVEQLFRDWLLANLLADPTLADGQFGYLGVDQGLVAVTRLQPGSEALDERVHQFAGDYYQLAADGPAELHVEVAPTVPLIPSDNVHGTMFWSLRGDNLDTRLTRRFDLSAVSSATLRYRLWYDLEPDYDVCYTLASSDGAAWVPLSARWSSDAENLGAILGPGYSGSSGGGPVWLDEEVDLARYAGGPAYVRFECVTDQGYSGPGLALDEIQLPEIGFYDDAEIDKGWLAEGFVRAPNRMTQPASVLVAEVGGTGLSLREVPLDSAGRGQISVSGRLAGVERTAVLLAGLAPVTLEEMRYRLWLAQP